MSTYSSTEAKRTSVVATAGGTTESLGGVVVVILSILALVGVLPGVLAAIAGIVFGAAFIVEGAAIASRQSAVTAQTAEPLEIGGVTVELVTGLAAIVLGVLALVGIVPPVLMGALVITAGAGLILSIGVVSRMNAAMGAAPVTSAAAAHLMAGIAAVVLGILSLTRPELGPVLSTVGLLVLGGSLTLSGTALSTALLRMFQRG